MPPKETPLTVSTDNTAAFITRWVASGAAECANYQLFLAELCELLAVQRPEPATPHDTHNGYVFERSVAFQHGDGTSSVGFIDLYTSPPPRNHSPPHNSPADSKAPAPTAPRNCSTYWFRWDSHGNWRMDGTWRCSSSGGEMNLPDNEWKGGNRM